MGSARSGPVFGSGRRVPAVRATVRSHVGGEVKFKIPSGFSVVFRQLVGLRRGWGAAARAAPSRRRQQSSPEAGRSARRARGGVCMGQPRLRSRPHGGYGRTGLQNQIRSVV